jgi:hypothetical protein
MRYALLLALPLTFACGGDDDGGDTTGVTSVATTSATADGSGSDSTPGDSGDTAPGDSSGGGMAGGPTIDSVTWTNPPGCTAGMGGDVNVTISVSDPDNDASEITLSGLVIGCTGDLNAASVTLVCPNAATYNGTVNAVDPDGNEDSLDIEIEPCVDGSAP